MVFGLPGKMTYEGVGVRRGDDEDEGGGDDVDGFGRLCDAVDGDDVVGMDDDGEVVMERSGGYWPEVAGNSPKNITAPKT
ncbi:hypothetical protein Tco_0545475 [Tanacetum coccineum]